MSTSDSPTLLEILFEDEHCLVVNKPFGLSTQAPRGIDSLELQVRSWLQKAADDRMSGAPKIYLGLPHRLDRPVSGAILLAKTKKGARKLSRQFERRLVKKVYWALVEGKVAPTSGNWIDWMRKIPGEARVETMASEHPQAQQAILRYSVLGETQHGSWLQIELETGRMHQIRLQASMRSWPILGDFAYGSRVNFGPQFEDRRRQAIALHARQLTFIQPVTQREISVKAPLGPAWREMGIDEHSTAC
jgi:23S rRNA pseudouridine1911/1915/1917 synthase